jgi:hypothetical protein
MFDGDESPAESGENSPHSIAGESRVVFPACLRLIGPTL